MIRIAAPALLGLAALSLPAHANDFPTHARVEYVLACMHDRPAADEAAVYKCSCAIDAIAEQVSYDQWVDLSTMANAITIAGERGGALRDLKGGRGMVTRYRDIQAKARKGCFLEK
jgi:hypothetical protein